MPRPHRFRRVRCRPTLNYFKPAGARIKELDEIILNLDEFEAIRFIDLEEKEQLEACKKMEISQPTLSRLLKSGRKKIAEALIKGKAIKIEGGNCRFR